MEISVVVASRPNRPPEEDLRVAETADRLGYSEVWVGEGWVWDPFALATAVGLRTERCALTVGPVPVAVRDPVTIAMSTASTAALVGRPVGVALGTSSVRFVERLHGRQRRRPAIALAESARAVRSLLSGRHTELHGEVLATDGYRLRLEPPGGPLTVAAFGDRAVAVAGAHADRMVLDLVSPGMVTGFRSRLDAAAASADRTPPSLAAWVPAAVDPDPASSAELMQSLAGYLAVAGYAEVFASVGFGDAVELAREGAGPDALVAALPDDAAYRIGIVGDGDTVRARLAAYAEAGLDEVVLVPATAGDPGGKRTLAAITNLRDTVR